MNRNTARPPDELGPPLPRFLAAGKGDCATYPRPDDFTDEGTTAAQVRTTRRAVRVCAGCPFRYPCANWALEHRQEGVYGGTTTKEREALRAQSDALPTRS